MPKSSIAHNCNWPFLTFLGRCVEEIKGRCRGSPQAITHGGCPNIEWRQDGEQVTADIAGNVVLTDPFLHDL